MSCNFDAAFAVPISPKVRAPRANHLAERETTAEGNPLTLFYMAIYNHMADLGIVVHPRAGRPDPADAFERTGPQR